MIITMKANEVKFSKRCEVSGEFFCITVDTKDYCKFRAGVHVQDVWPDMPKENREFIINGTTPAEWDEMFGVCALGEEL
tara:strand:+ start:806 stop:1042 length:237 start_codon:yes stop_codon:yes gene_type:complete